MSVERSVLAMAARLAFNRRRWSLRRLEVAAAEVAAAAEVPPSEAPASEVPAAEAAAVEAAAVAPAAVHRAPAAVTAEHAAAEHRAEEDPRKQASAEESAHVRGVRGAGVPVRDLAAADHDLARVGLLAALDALGIGLADRHLPGLAPRRGVHHGSRGRAVARVEEAGRGPLGRLLALEARPRGGHRVAPLLDGGAHRLELLRRAGAVDRRRRPLVGAERGLVVGLRLLRHARHLDVEVERADLVAALHHITAHRAGALLEPLRLPPPLAAPAREQQPAAPHREG